MTSTVDVRRTAVLRRAAVRATFAPSVHNTQPWRFVLSRGELKVYADRRRQLMTLDPLSRQLTMSCGAAVMNARVAIAAAGFGARVERFPDPLQADLVATVTTDEPDASTGALATLDPFIERRQTNRRRFADDKVPAGVLAVLVAAAAAEDGTLFVISDEPHRRAVARLSRQADEAENANPAYRAEIRAWTTDDPARTDGIPRLAVPHVDDREPDEMPLRDFDSAGAGYLPADTHSTRDQCLVVLGTDSDREVDWLRGGEALERVLLEVTKHGFVAGPLTQATDLAPDRAELRSDLGLSMSPLVVLRIGRAPLTPAARRRRLVDVLVEEA